MPRAVSADRPRSKPKLGQHFLNAEDYAARVVDALGDITQSTVLEIGPGRGILTSLLAKQARRLIAVAGDLTVAELQLRHLQNAAALPFGRLWYGEPNAIGYSKFFSPFARCGDSRL